MEALKKNLMPPVDKEKKLRESCEGFESIFIQKMWEQMRATIPEGGFLKGREEKFWQSMYDQELAKVMAGAGGIGLADMMYEQLSRNLHSASKSTANAVGGQPSGFAAEISPAPLLPTAVAAQTKAAPGSAEAPAQQQTSSALAGLYAEYSQTDALPDAPPQAATQPALGAAAAQPTTEAGTDPAILAVLNELRAARQTGAQAGGQQTSAPNGLSLGARPPLPPMQDDGHMLTPAQQIHTSYPSTLSKPVQRPASGKNTVLPSATPAPRVPADQPVHRNLPFAQEAAQLAPSAAATDRPTAGG